ncbi:MAG: sugar phosphate isomerase/epimerase, partial [Pirellulales bacterium]|nr:sugar phosphate isomerase/epimerase [Pirellulales bacterium]
NKIIKWGYQGVELMVKNPRKYNKDKIEQLIHRYNLDVPVICTGEVFGEDGLSFMDVDKTVRELAIKRTKEIIEFAARFKAQVNVGRLRGHFVKEVERKKLLDYALFGFEECINYAEKYNVCIILEPINSMITNFINTTQEGIKFVQKINRKNFRLMLDLFHMNIEEEDVAAALVSVGKHIGHVHWADSNRRAVGMGHTDPQPIVSALQSVGFKGFLSAEVFPLPTSNDAAKQTINSLQKYRQ